jgi:hypothetical protein
MACPSPHSEVVVADMAVAEEVGGGVEHHPPSLWVLQPGTRALTTCKAAAIAAIRASSLTLPLKGGEGVDIDPMLGVVVSSLATYND